jgi:hypothetical protein
VDNGLHLRKRINLSFDTSGVRCGYNGNPMTIAFTASLALAIAGFRAAPPDEQGVPPRHLESTAIDDETLAGFRAGLGPIGVPVLAMSIPRQTTSADLERACRLLEVGTALTQRLLAAHKSALISDDAFRARRLPAVFGLAAEVVKPSAPLSAEQIAQFARDLAGARRKVLADMLAQEREALQAALGGEELGPAELESLDAIAQIRLVELVETAVATPDCAKVGVGRLIETRGRQVLGDASIGIARAIYRDALPELAGLARGHQLAFGRSIGIGAKFTLASRIEKQFGSLPANVVADWSSERAAARRNVARAGERIFEANRAVVESICAAIGGAEAERLRTQYDRLVFGLFASGAWDASALLKAEPGAGVDPADSDLQPLSREYEAQSGARLRELQREFIRYQVLEAGSMGVRRDDWARAREQLASIQRRGRDETLLLFDQLRARIDPPKRDAWDAAVERFRAAAEEAAMRQLDALDPQFAKR